MDQLLTGLRPFKDTDIEPLAHLLYVAHAWPPSAPSRPRGHPAPLEAPQYQPFRRCERPPRPVGRANRLLADRPLQRRHPPPGVRDRSPPRAQVPGHRLGHSMRWCSFARKKRTSITSPRPSSRPPALPAANARPSLSAVASGPITATGRCGSTISGSEPKPVWLPGHWRSCLQRPGKRPGHMGTTDRGSVRGRCHPTEREGAIRRAWRPIEGYFFAVDRPQVARSAQAVAGWI